MTATATVRRRIPADFSNTALYNRAYIPLFANQTPFLHLYGGAGSGKSRFVAQREIVESFEPARRNRKTLIIRKVATTLKDSVYSELKTVIYDWQLEKHFEILKSPMQITNATSGVTFLFIGLDDVEKVKSISGVDRIWIEEATELDTFRELRQLRLRLRGVRDVQITLTYNPVDENHWLNREVHEQAPLGHFIFKTTYRDNEKMLEVSPEYAEYIESLAADDSNYYRVYGEGLWGKVVEGLIYQEFEVIDEFPQSKDAFGNSYDDVEFYGLDFGYSDPTALVAQCVRDASPKKRLINKELLYKAGLDGPALVREFAALNIRKDRTIVADNARPEMIKTLMNAGYRVEPCVKRAGSVLSGINDVRKFHIQIVAGSKHMLAEIHNYQKNQVQGMWQEEPAKSQADHALDAMRYGAETQNKTRWAVSEFRF